MPLDCTTPECAAQLAAGDPQFLRYLVAQVLASIGQSVEPAAIGVELTDGAPISLPNNASTAVAAADPDRRIAWVQNPSNSPIWLSHTDPAVVGSGILLPAGGIYEFGNGEWFTGQGLWAIQNSGGPVDILLVTGVIAP